MSTPIPAEMFTDKMPTAVGIPETMADGPREAARAILIFNARARCAKILPVRPAAILVPAEAVEAVTPAHVAAEATPVLAAVVAIPVVRVAEAAAAEDAGNFVRAVKSYSNGIDSRC